MFKIYKLKSKKDISLLFAINGIYVCIQISAQKMPRTYTYIRTYKRESPSKSKPAG